VKSAWRLESRALAPDWGPRRLPVHAAFTGTDPVVFAGFVPSQVSKAGFFDKLRAGFRAPGSDDVSTTSASRASCRPSSTRNRRSRKRGYCTDPYKHRIKL
jgi:hypothetical protein